MSEHHPNQISEQLLLAVKMEKDNSSLRKALENIPISELQSELNTDDKRKAFWINIYNAFFLILRKEEKLGKAKIYLSKRIVIAGKSFSLDDVEHGILRKDKYKKAVTFIMGLLRSKNVKNFVVDELDYRIHFALNCGAKSCPPIAFYHADKIDRQLDIATQNFLESESEYDHENKILHTSTLCKWYLDDFGGKDGVRKMYLEQLEIDVSDYKILYKDYLWEEALDNFV